jgi:hypothetical protein
MAEPNWDRTPWNAEPGALYGDREYGRDLEGDDTDDEELTCDGCGKSLENCTCEERYG